MNCGLIIVEGNIGAGKSTFSKALAERLNGEYLAEPDEATNPYLADYYKDPARWAFDIQMYLLSKRYRMHQDAQTTILNRKDKFIVMDRSYYGDVCFAQVQKQMGYFSDRDYATYIALHTDMKVHVLPPTLAIFLEATPDVCKERIDKRMSEKEGRKCEAGIDMAYLDALNVEIGKLADSMTGKTVVKRLNWNDDKSPFEIKAVCNEIAVELKVKKHSVYDFWTGTDGIGR